MNATKYMNVVNQTVSTLSKFHNPGVVVNEYAY